jgi:hypothetical protein
MQLKSNEGWKHGRKLKLTSPVSFRGGPVACVPLCGSFYGSCSTVPLSPQTHSWGSGDRVCGPSRASNLKKTARSKPNTPGQQFQPRGPRRRVICSTAREALAEATAHEITGILLSAKQLNKREKKRQWQCDNLESVQRPKQFPVWDECAGPLRARLLPWCRDPGSCCYQKRTTACTAHEAFLEKKHRDQRIAVSFRHQ